DFCQETGLNDFEAQAQATMKTLAKMHSKAVIAVVAIPNVPQLFSITSDGEVASSLEGDLVEELLGGSKNFTCGQVREAFAACPVMTTAINKAQRLTDMNAILAQAVASVDVNSNKFIFVSEVGAATFAR